jgi:hypothetical protein
LALVRVDNDPVAARPLYKRSMNEWQAWAMMRVWGQNTEARAGRDWLAVRLSLIDVFFYYSRMYRYEWTNGGEASL